MKKTFWILLVLALIFWFLDSRGHFNWLHFFWGKQTHPSRQASLGLFQTAIEEESSRQEEIEVLKLKIAQLDEENRTARRLLGADLSPKLKFIPAHLLGLGGDSFSLDQGSLAQIVLGSFVLEENILVGKITKVNSFSSQGIMVNNNQFSLAVGIWRFGEEKTLAGKGLLRGGSTLVVSEILAEEEVKEDDLVASLEADGEFLIGKIASVDWDQSKIFKKATVAWLANPRLLRTVMVVKQ